jgi:hypothetical protein
MEYTIVTGTIAYRVAEEVNLFLSKGWQLKGELTVSTFQYSNLSSETRYTQVLIKE